MGGGCCGGRPALALGVDDRCERLGPRALPGVSVPHPGVGRLPAGDRARWRSASARPRGHRHTPRGAYPQHAHPRRSPRPPGSSPRPSWRGGGPTGRLCSMAPRGAAPGGRGLERLADVGGRRPARPLAGGGGLPPRCRSRHPLRRVSSRSCATPWGPVLGGPRSPSAGIRSARSRGLPKPSGAGGTHRGRTSLPPITCEKWSRFLRWSPRKSPRSTRGPD